MSKFKEYDWTGYTTLERLYCYEFMVDRSKGEAAIRAGYKKQAAKQQATRVYKKCESRINEMLNDLTEPHNVTVDRIIQELAKIGFMDARQFFDDNGNPIAIQNLSDDAASVIAGMKVRTESDGDDGEVATITEYKLNDKIDALRLLGQNLQMFTKKLVIDDKRPLVVVKDMTGRKKTEQ